MQIAKRSQRAQLVDQLLRVKQRYHEISARDINLTRLLNDIEYRQRILLEGLRSDDVVLQRLAAEAHATSSGKEVEPPKRDEPELTLEMVKRPAVAPADIPETTGSYSFSTAPAANEPNTASTKAAPAQAAANTPAEPEGFPGWAYYLLAPMLAALLGSYFLTGDRFDAPHKDTSRPNVGTPPALEQSLQPPADPLSQVSAIPLRLHGSYAIAEKLAPQLMLGFMRAQGATDVELYNGNKPNSKIVKAQWQGKPIGIEILGQGTVSGFRAVGDGSADIGIATRPVKNEELTRYGNTLAGGENVIGIEALAIVVHPANPINSLTLEQVALLFAGHYGNWSQVGGEDAPVKLYTWPQKSGGMDSFRSLVLNRYKLNLSGAAEQREAGAKIANAVAEDPAAIGFVNLADIGSAKAVAIADTSGMTPIVPTTFTASTEDYPLSQRLYFYLPPKSKNTMARRFLDFAKSVAGQNIAKQAGFIPQTVYATRTGVIAEAPAEYQRYIQNAERLSINIRFNAGSADFDSKADGDIRRLITYLENNHGKQLMLFGFTDNVGSPGENVKLSLKRVKLVEQQLLTRGIKPLLVKGLGSIMPLASNDTEDGRNRNRRVEIWVK